MNDDLKDILSNSNKDIDNQLLIDYLSKQLNKTEQHEVEKAMTDDSFVNDAVEGLQNFKEKKDIQSYVTALHDDLQKQLAKKKKRKDGRKWKEQPWIYLAIVLILILLIICFIIVKKHLDINP
jgi:hypothetical protein